MEDFMQRSISFLLLFLLSVFLIIPIKLQASDLGDAKSLVEKSTLTFKAFIQDPEMDWFTKNARRAKAILIIPQNLKAGFLVGGSGGSGVLLDRDLKNGEWSYPAFYSIGSATFGLQIGAESSEIIMMIMTKKGMDSMLTTSFKLGGDITVAAGPIGIGAKAATTDVLAFAKSKGAFGGLTIEGAVIKTRDNLNAAYYGKKVSPTDILVQRSVNNPHADSLKKLISENSAQQIQKVKY